MPADQLNVEYFYRLLYECLRGGCSTTADTSGLMAFLSHLWLWIVVIGYLVALFALIMIVYTTMRLFELRKREEAYYGTLLVAPDEKSGANPRWAHVESLIDSDNPSDWRQAIIEADIMLDDMLTVQSYIGETVGEKLKTVERSDFNTIDDAWEAHKVRNQIAHEGSAFELTEQLARRTIARYENVFREFEMI